MPRAFSKTDRDHIRKALMTAGLKRFAIQGVRAVRVDDICRDAGIAKGSFYTFFASKEELFMGIADARDLVHKGDIRAFVETAPAEPQRIVPAFFDMMMEKIETDPVLGAITGHGEITYLVRKLGPERMAQSHGGDREFLEDIAGLLVKRDIAPYASEAVLEGLMALMLSLAMQKSMMAGKSHAITVALLREMFVTRLTKGA